VSSLFSRYPSRPPWSLPGSSHTPYVGSLFSRYPSCPVWSLRCSSHMPYVGSLFVQYPSRLAWSLRGSSHMSCMDSLFLGSGGCTAGHGDREVGLWREIIFDFDLSRFNTTCFVCYSSPYCPRGVSIFPNRRRSIHTKEKNKQDRNQGSQRMTQNRETGKCSNSIKETNRICPSSRSSCRS